MMHATSANSTQRLEDGMRGAVNLRWAGTSRRYDERPRIVDHEPLYASSDSPESILHQVAARLEYGRARNGPVDTLRGRPIGDAAIPRTMGRCRKDDLLAIAPGNHEEALAACGRAVVAG